MKKILTLTVSLIALSASVMADDVAAERFHQRATNWGGTTQTSKSVNQGKTNASFSRLSRPSFQRRMPPSQENNFPTSAYSANPNYTINR